MSTLKPAWNSKNEERAVKAVEKINDATTLARAAKIAYCWEARKAAVEKLADLKYFDLSK